MTTNMLTTLRGLTKWDLSPFSLLFLFYLVKSEVFQQIFVYCYLFYPKISVIKWNLNLKDTFLFYICKFMI